MRLGTHGGLFTGVAILLLAGCGASAASREPSLNADDGGEDGGRVGPPRDAAAGPPAGGDASADGAAFVDSAVDGGTTDGQAPSDAARDGGADVGIDASCAVRPATVPWPGLGGACVGTADFDGDGSPDLVVGCGGASVLLGRGDGTFATGFAKPASASHGVVTADFDGDGHADFALAADSSSGAYATEVWLGKGDGTFRAAALVTSGAGGAAIASADFDGDGKADLVVATPGYEAGAAGLDVLLGKGDGSFAAPLATGIASAAVQATDMNGDGRPDLVVTAAATILVALGRGDGTFGAPVSYPAGGSIAVGGLPVAADVDQDGAKDVIVGLGSQVAVLRGRGDGSLQSPVLSTLPGTFSGRLVQADLDGDGIPDLAVGSPDVVVLRGHGDGTFAVRSQVVAPGAAVLVDVNRDGRADLAGGGAVLLGRGDGTFFTSARYAAVPGPTALVTADFNGDALADVAVAASGGNSVGLLLGVGGGALAAPLVATVGNPSALAAADVDGDGRVDLAVATGSQASILLGKGNGTFQPAVGLGGAPGPGAVAIADVDGDGRLDVVAAGSAQTGGGSVTTFLGTGGGHFSPAVDSPLGCDSGAAIAVGDLNGDGVPDLVVGGSTNYGGEWGSGWNTCAFVMIGKGDGTFAPGSALVSPRGGTVNAVAIAHFDGDGRLDVMLGVTGMPAPNCEGLLCYWGPSFVSVQLGAGNGRFRRAATLRLPQGIGAAVAGDVTGDGKLDVVVPMGGLDTAALFAGLGDGTFQPATQYGAGLGPTAAAITDLDGDGRPDLAVANQQGGDVTVLANVCR